MKLLESCFGFCRTIKLKIHQIHTQNVTETEILQAGTL